MTSLDQATLDQVNAATPIHSTWLSANAGSGKTRVLTDRVARLLLLDVPPQNILCLTYTKAAASEMQNRLFQRLGEWAMLEETKLAEKLSSLSNSAPPSTEHMAKARRLFARAIETPGGLKIQTIHSFCAKILRQFPLEAGVSANFTEIDDKAAKQLRKDCLNDMVSLYSGAFDAFVAISGRLDLEDTTETICANRAVFDDLNDQATVLPQYGLDPAATPENIILSVMDGWEKRTLRSYAEDMCAYRMATVQKIGQALGDFCDDPTQGAFDRLVPTLLYSAKSKVAPFEPSKQTFDRLRRFSEDAADALLPFAEQLSDAKFSLMALGAAKETLVLRQFAKPFLSIYAKRKAASGWLDFEDLLIKTHQLLSRSDMAQWVLYRLDGGIGHILVDEAQDTSPIQWSIIERLSEEMTAGLGIDDAPRTLFVVGDKKQSIYSFQGADPKSFDVMNQRFGERLRDAESKLHNRKLEYSFRSSSPILQAVDATFRKDHNAGLEADVHHKSFHTELPGRVDLWPTIEETPKPDQGNWEQPVDRLQDTHHFTQLADRIASEIVRMKRDENLWDLDGGTLIPRRISEGDVLILVQRRSTLFHEIIRACKKHGLRVAGADRLKLNAELAVKDLRSLLLFLATPEDDLSLAEALKSPIFSWTENDLFQLAAPRNGKFLWEALRARKEEWPRTVEIIQALLAQTDFLRPFELLEQILVAHKGRENLIARLGSEAIEGIDVLSDQALTYEMSETPSLTGFAAWLSSEDIELKRQADNASDAIRIMTVHGAKGLEAPIVYLPDSSDRKEDFRDKILKTDVGMIWKRNKDKGNGRAMDLHLAKEQEKLREERARLLYVAMTRAEQWLVVCAAGKAENPAQSWHHRVGDGLSTLPTISFDIPGLGEGRRLERWRFDVGKPTLERIKDDNVLLPHWIDDPVPPATTAIGTFAPSALTGPKALAGDIGPNSPEHAMLCGTLLHRLLEILPSKPPQEHQALVDWLIETTAGAEAISKRDLLSEALGVLAAPHLSHLFTDTLSEITLTAPVLGRRFSGSIDKLLITDTSITAVDFKSNAVVPEKPDEVPIGILRQMGAYQMMLDQIYSDFTGSTATAILWTKTATLMPLPHSLVIKALQSDPLLDPAHMGA